MILESLIVNYMFNTNCYLFGDEKTSEIVIIDPGGNFSDIKNMIEKNKFKPIAVILTHAHGDHIGAAKEVMEFFDIPLMVHKNELQRLKFKKEFKLIKENDVIEVGSEKLHVIDSPGHTSGGIMLISYDNKLIITGDTIFHRSIGRTDFGGNYNQLMKSIHKIFTNPKISDDFFIFPGHMEKSTIGFERQFNMFRKDFL
ncbi:MAG: MBL fold metallo-hydrolase [Promethearchaeota archaeon]